MIQVPVSLAIANLDDLFPFHVSVNHNLEVVTVGRSLLKLVDLKIGDQLSDRFAVHQPKLYSLTYESLASSKRSMMFLQVNAVKPFKLRGEWTMNDEQSLLFFAGTPFYQSWEEVKQYGLTVDDFARHDPLIDLLLLHQTQELTEQNVLKLTEKIIINETFVRIFHKFTSMIWRAASDKRFDYFNETWFEFTGRTMEREIGFGWTDSIHPDDASKYLSVYMTSFNQRVPFDTEIRLRNRKGEFRFIRVYGQPYTDKDDRFMGYIGSCYDVTTIRENEVRLNELNTMKDNLLSIIAHDLKNPLVNIVGLVDILAKNYGKTDPQTVGTVIRNLDNTARTTFGLLQSLLEWSRSQKNDLRLNLRPFKFAEACDEVLDSLRPLADVKHIKIERELQDELEIVADENMFKTVVRNLVGNAIKFTHENGKVNISALRQNGDYKFVISDNGVGIPQEQIARLFETTRNKPTFGTANEKGTGLGLMLCKDFVNRHNGKIWAESKAGAGTDFIFTIPFSENTLTGER